MPTWDKVLKEVNDLNPLKVVDRYISALSEFTGRTTICYMSAFTVIKPPVPSPFHSIIDQDMEGFMTCSNGVNRDALDLVIHTPGGDYEATKRIINYLNEVYKHIRVFVPHMAMSGGTLIACSADEIYMGPYSSIGPTDPQVFIHDSYVPAEAVINEFKSAFDDVSRDPSNALLWNERLNQVPFGMLKAMETMNTHSLAYLADLLLERNCKGQNRKDSEKIAKSLNSHDRHSSHGKGISFKMAGELGLTVKDLRDEKKLEDLVLSIYHACIILFEKTSTQKIIANHKSNRYINNFSG